MDIFKLVGSVFVDTDKANDSLQKTDEKAGSLGGTFAKMGKAVGTAALAIGTAAVGAGAALVGMANNAAQTADAVDKGSLRMGVSTTYFQELQYAAGQCGVEMSTMEQAAKKLEGTDINFEDAMAQIMSLGTEAERTQMASELFGDSLAYKLGPVLAQSGEDFTGLMDRANELGIVMSEDSVAAGVKLGDSMSDVKQSFGAVATELGTAMMPIIQDLLDWIIEHMPEIKETITKVTDVLTNVIFPAVGTAINWLKEKFETYWPVISGAVSSAVETIKSIWENNLKPIVETVWGFISNIWEVSIKPAFEGVITFFQGVFSGDIEKAFDGLSQYIDGVWSGLVEIIRIPVNAIIGVINGLIRGVTDGINSVIRALNRLQIDVPQWVTDLTGLSSFGFHIAELVAPQIPLLASGGDIAQSGTAVVGENGPELLQLPKGARVTPLEENKQTTVNVTVDVHPAPGMDEVALANMVAERIQNSIDRKAAAWA